MGARVQQPAPHFACEAVVNCEFKDVSLSDYKGKYLVLFFYPLDFTFVCPTEILAFNDRVEEFRKIGCEVVAASVDSKFTHLAWLNTPRKDGGIAGVTIPLLADLKKDVARDYGVLLPDGVALRGLFVIDPKGIVRHITINDLPIGRSVDEALRVVQAVQFADQHGEVCPANWTPGKDTMKADPEGSKEYFRKAGAGAGR
jgi:alkyl hydroperoxide reductase subunit AhpC